MKPINICIILMTQKRKSENNYKKHFRDSFKYLKDVKIHFIRWDKEDLIDYIINRRIKGIILSGSEYRILKNKVVNIDLKIFKLNIPILGECYGYQWMVKKLGNREHLSSHSDKKIHNYNKKIIINTPFKIKKNKYFFNHFDYIKKVPKNWISLIKDKKQIWMAYDSTNKNIGIQFHPEKYKRSGRIFYKKWIKYITS